jgi:hypothetical protein
MWPGRSEFRRSVRGEGWQSLLLRVQTGFHISAMGCLKYLRTNIICLKPEGRKEGRKEIKYVFWSQKIDLTTLNIQYLKTVLT